MPSKKDQDATSGIKLLHTFRIRFTAGKAAEYVRERIWAEAQKLEETPDGGVLLEITTRSEPELMAWVRSFGPEASVCRPEEGPRSGNGCVPVGGAIGVVANASLSSGPVPDFLRAENTAAIQRFHASVPGYECTPLVALDALAQRLGVKAILVKDEAKRFGLNAFKGLGGSYAIFRVVCEKLGLDADRATFADLQGPEHRAMLADTVFITATDGNHGKGVAWAAGLLGCKAVVYMPAGSSQARAQAIADAGKADVTITDLAYDDTVRLAAKKARDKGWTLVQDTSWEGYEQVPTWIVQGYATLAAEAVSQMEDKGLTPTHVFLQAGVGAMAGGILGYLADRCAARRPVFSIVEPDAVACIYASARAGDGNPHPATGTGSTIMAGLNCGEPCTVTWPVLRDFAAYYFACPDHMAAEGMRAYANPAGNDPAVVSGESGGVTLGLVLHLLQSPDMGELREKMGLNEDAVIFLINTEGDTDPASYADIVRNGALAAPAP